MGSLKSFNQTRSIPPLTAHALQVAVKLINQGRDRQWRAISPRLLDTQPKILAHPVNGETKIEFILDHRQASVLHLPGLGSPFANNIEYYLHVDPGL
jgi:hypothetical protein